MRTATGSRQHERIAAALNAKTYFAKPCLSRELGIDENTNGHFGNFSPQETNFNAVAREQVDHGVTWLRNRTTKTRQYKTRNEVFVNQFVPLIRSRKTISLNYLDYTSARVVLANNPDLSLATVIETQIPVTWNNGTIGISVNLGKFNAGETAYLFVVNAVGRRNASGFPVRIGNQTAAKNRGLMESALAYSAMGDRPRFGPPPHSRSPQCRAGPRIQWRHEGIPDSA